MKRLRHAIARHPLSAIIVLSIAVRFLAVFVIGTPTPEHHMPTQDDYRYDTLAWHLASGHGYTNAFGLPEAKDPPLLPFVLAPIYIIFGHNFQAARLLFIVLGCISLILISKAGEILFGKNAGIATALVAALYPDLVSYSGLTLSECVFIPMLLASLLALILAFKSQQPLYFAASGILIGLAALARPEVLLAPFFISVALLAYRRLSFSDRLFRCGVYLSFFILAIVPWTIRNYRQYHAFIPVSVGSGVALYVGSYIPWAGLDVRNGQPIYSQPFFARITRGTNEVEGDKSLRTAAIKQVLRAPMQYARLVPRKLFVLFKSPDSVGVYGANRTPARVKLLLESYYLLTLALIAIGVLSLLKVDGMIVLLYLALPAYLTLVHTLTIPAARYAFPIIALLLPLAGAGLTRLVNQLSHRWTSTYPLEPVFSSPVDQLA